MFGHGMPPRVYVYGRPWPYPYGGAAGASVALVLVHDTWAVTGVASTTIPLHRAGLRTGWNPRQGRMLQCQAPTRSTPTVSLLMLAVRWSLGPVPLSRPPRRTDTRLHDKLGAATGRAVLDGRALSRRASSPLPAARRLGGPHAMPQLRVRLVSVSVSHPPAARACMRLPQSKEGARPDDDLSPPSPTSEAANQ